MNLFLELRKHGKLANKRHPMYEKSKFGKFWMYFMAIFWAGYLIFFGTTFAFAFDGGAQEAYQVLNSGLIFVLAIDFIIRFPFQKTPTQEVKPYMLLPIKRNRLIDLLLLRSGLDAFNLIWLFFFVPFSILTITKFYGIMGVFSYCLGIWLLIVFNNYWFLLCRTLIGERIWWIILPLSVYGGIAAGMLIPAKSPIFSYSATLGEGLITGSILTFLGILLAIACIGFINRRLMSNLVYAEINKVEDTKVKNISEYKFLDRYGEIGEYMRLELKLLLRNKVCKYSLRMVILLVLVFSSLISFTSVYDGEGMKNFLVVYNFVIFGILFLSSIMSYEGNYIDGLMSRKESIYNLLRAKYTVYSIAILIPFILMIPAMITKKVAVMSCVSWAVFSVGFVYFCLFQMAVYNNRTINLSVRMTGRNVGTGLQNLIAGASFGVPLILNVVLKALIGQETASWVLIIIGLSFILTSNLWIKNVYHRFMKRRYKNMEGFRDSRQ
ncbi:hypothetical protein FQ707_11130 [Bacteroidaceae bacterium HV4-6-C5C]|jgi:hypothetical protein|nr:hypothetical protein FQ707_11130 [Bacteroidaceae bacterium HV4-6-C5C]